MDLSSSREQPKQLYFTHGVLAIFAYRSRSYDTALFIIRVGVIAIRSPRVRPTW